MPLVWAKSKEERILFEGNVILYAVDILYEWCGARLAGALTVKAIRMCLYDWNCGQDFKFYKVVPCMLCACVYNIILSCSLGLRGNWSRFMISPEGHEECFLLGDFISGKSISWRCMTVAIAASVLYKNLALSCNLWSVTGICWPCAPLLTVTSHWIVQQGNMTVTADWQWEKLMTVTRWLRRRGILAWQYRHIQVDETDWWLRSSGI